MRLFAIGLTCVALIACDDSRFVYGTYELTVSGALTRAVRGRVHAGYGARMAGGGYEMEMDWSEEHPAQQKFQTGVGPLFGLSTDFQPTVGTYRISQWPRRGAGQIDAIVAVPGPALWNSDSGVVRITASDSGTLALAGSFDVWLQCHHQCPQSGREMRVRGSFVVP